MHTDMGAETSKNHEVLDDHKTYILIMIKPNAIEETSDSVILDMFSGNCEKYIQHMDLEEAAINSLRSVKLVTYFYRRLDDPRYRPVLDFLYQKENGKKHHSVIMKEYAGPCAFIIASSSMEAEQFYEGMQILKGKGKLLDKENIVRKGTGIRGVLIVPRQFMDMDKLDDNEIRITVRNTIHVPDSQQESAKAIRMLLSSSEIDSLSTRNKSFSKFINTYAPIDIVRSG